MGTERVHHLDGTTATPTAKVVEAHAVRAWWATETSTSNIMRIEVLEYNTHILHTRYCVVELSVPLLPHILKNRGGDSTGDTFVFTRSTSYNYIIE